MAASAAAMLLLAACGGRESDEEAAAGGASDVVVKAVKGGGLATMGLPMAGASVTFVGLDGATRVGPVTADDTGAFAVPDGVPVPALVEAVSASGLERQYGYLADRDQARVAVNPLTTGLLAMASGSHPSAITAALAAADLDRARSELATTLGQVVSGTGIESPADLLSTFARPGAGALDRVLDAVDVVPRPDGRVIFAERMTGGEVTVAKGSPLALAFGGSARTEFAASRAAVAACGAFLDGISDEDFSAGTRGADGPQLFDAAYLDDGRAMADEQAVAVQLAERGGGFVVRAPRYAGKDARGALRFVVDLHGKSTRAPLQPYRVMTVRGTAGGGGCALAGNGLPFEVSLDPVLYQVRRTDGVAFDAKAVNGLRVRVGVPADATDGRRNRYGGKLVFQATLETCNPDGTCAAFATLENTGRQGRGWFDVKVVASTVGTSAAASGGRAQVIVRKSGTEPALFTGTLVPIRVRFLDVDGAQIGDPVFVAASGRFFTDAEAKGLLQLPTVLNAAALTSTRFADPTVRFDAASASGLVSSVQLLYRDDSDGGSSMRSVRGLGTGTVGFDFTEADGATAYRSVVVTSHFPGVPGLLETKYLWAPSEAKAQ